MFLIVAFFILLFFFAGGPFQFYFEVDVHLIKCQINCIIKKSVVAVICLTYMHVNIDGAIF